MIKSPLRMEMQGLLKTPWSLWNEGYRTQEQPKKNMNCKCLERCTSPWFYWRKATSISLTITTR